MNEWQEKFINLKENKNMTYAEMIPLFKKYFINATDIQIHNKLRHFYTVYNKTNINYNSDVPKNNNQNIDITNTKVSYKENGDEIFEGIIELLEGEPMTPETVLKAHNLKLEEWKVIAFTSNAWQSQQVGGKKITLWQSKITVRPLKNSEITTTDIDKYFQNKKWNARKTLSPFSYNQQGEVLEIDYTDAHTGLLSWREETGKDYDLDIVEARFYECIADIIVRCKGRRFRKIIFATIGDILHIDNDKNETTKGTIQQADGRITKIFNKAVDMMVNCLDSLLGLHAPIEYVYTAGNHDRNTGYFLAKTLEMAYRNETNITFDISPNPQKAKQIGNVLVGFCHGDMPQKNLGEWLQKTYRIEYGNTKFAEVHCGHLHSESTKESCGVLIKHLPAICESSYWEHQQGYKSSKGMMCFVWNVETGLRETWYNYI